MAMTFADLVARNAALSGEVQRSHEALKVAQLTIDKMKVELAYLRRMKYGRSSERLEHPQLELVGGQVAQPVVEPPAEGGEDDGLKSNVTSLDKERKKREFKTRPGLLEHIVVSKFADHVPLYRLCQIYGRDGVELSRSTITDMVGNCGVLLAPLAEAVGRYVLKAHKVHGDDTPIRALSGKGKKAHQGRLWVYVRDDRPSGDKAPQAVWFQ